MGHWCGTFHKTSDAKVRLARIRNIRISECELEFFFFFLVTLVRSHWLAYIGASS